VVWTLALGVLAMAAIVVIIAWRIGRRNLDRGSVSDHWIAQHRRDC